MAELEFSITPAELGDLYDELRIEVLGTPHPHWDMILDDRLNRLARQLSLTLG